MKKEKELWLVTYQLPFTLIVGIYKTEKEAIKHDSKIGKKNCPLFYPCPIDRIKNQSGYRKYHDKIIEKLINI